MVKTRKQKASKAEAATPTTKIIPLSPATSRGTATVILVIILQKMQTFSKDHEKERHANFQDQEFLPSRVLNWEVLQTQGLDDEFEKYLRVGGLFEFVDNTEPAYQELTIDFLSTFAENKKATNEDPIDMLCGCLGCIKGSL